MPRDERARTDGSISDKRLVDAFIGDCSIGVEGQGGKIESIYALSDKSERRAIIERIRGKRR